MKKKYEFFLYSFGFLIFGTVETIYAINRIELNQVQASFFGEKAPNMLGNSVSIVGDVNGDEFDDILIAANANSENGEAAGKTYLIFGKSEGWQIGTSTTQADASFIGVGEHHWSGCSISDAGDVNGDGYDDFLIGAFGYSRRDNPVIGHTYLILGKADGWQKDLSLSNVDASFVGEHENDSSGLSVAGGGDVNGDGYDDILIGAPFNSDAGYRFGQVYLIFGKPTGLKMFTKLNNADASFLGEAKEDVAGWSVSIVGDVNGDEYDDIVIGAAWSGYTGYRSGRVYLIFGKPEGWKMRTPLAEADMSYIGEGSYNIAGFSVSGAGDVNGDGFDDFVICAADQAYLIFGKINGWRKDTPLSQADASFMEENLGEEALGCVSGGGDVNNDGFSDFLIGAPWNTNREFQEGQTYLIFGRPKGWRMRTPLSEADFSFVGEAPEDQSGPSVSNAGDIDGDGFDDILIGSPGSGLGDLWDSVGQAYLCFYPQSLFISTDDLPHGAVGYTFSEALSVHGGTPPYKWEQIAGTLPDGLTFDSAGIISGTPISVDSTVITILVTDSASKHHKKEFTVVIGEARKGDVNIDGEISILDVTLTVGIMIGFNKPTSVQNWAADFNGDQSINVLDVVQIIRLILTE